MVDCDINVSGANNVGSIVGYMEYNYKGNSSECKESACYASGQICVSGVQANVGGLIGHCDSRYDFALLDCYNTCKIDCDSSSDYIGGLVGLGEVYGYAQKITFARCYNVGMISANGGDCSAGSILGYSLEINGSSRCYYNYCNSLSGTADTVQGKGRINEDSTHNFLTETQMKNQKLFTGFDFENTWEFDIFCGYNYPQLKKNRQVRASSVKVTPPEQLSYPQGDSLNLNGGTVEVTYEKSLSGGTLLPLALDMLSDYDMEKLGKQTVTVMYGGVSSSFEIEVLPIPVTGISFSDEDMELYSGEQYQMEAVIEPANASDKGVIWESSNEEIVSVDTEGLLTARRGGEATITVISAEDESIKATCNVTVQVAADVLTLDKTSMSLHVGEQDTLSASLLPLNCTEVVEWSSGDPEVVQIEEDKDGNVLVKAVGVGVTGVYACTEKKELSEYCEVVVLGDNASGDDASGDDNLGDDNFGDDDWWDDDFSDDEPEQTAQPVQSVQPIQSTQPVQPTQPQVSQLPQVPNQDEQTGSTNQKQQESEKDNAATTITTSAAVDIGDLETDEEETDEEEIRQIRRTGAKIVSISNVKKRGFRVKLKGLGPCDGYQVEYSLKSNMKSSKRVNRSASTVIVTKLKQRKTYYVRVRTFGTVNGVRYYGPWSAKKKVKIRK